MLLGFKENHANIVICMYVVDVVEVVGTQRDHANVVVVVVVVVDCWDPNRTMPTLYVDVVVV